MTPLRTPRSDFVEQVKRLEPAARVSSAKKGDGTWFTSIVWWDSVGKCGVFGEGSSQEASEDKALEEYRKFPSRGRRS